MLDLVCRKYHRRRSSRVTGSTLPLHADVRLHIPMTHRNDRDLQEAVLRQKHHILVTSQARGNVLRPVTSMTHPHFVILVQRTLMGCTYYVHDM